MKYTKSLKGSISFKKVLKQGKYKSNNNISIYAKKNMQDNNNYLGICVSKKHGNSVLRNKLKRWVREAYYSYENDLNTGFSIIVLFKKNIDINNIDYFAIKQEINDLFYKLGLFNEQK